MFIMNMTASANSRKGYYMTKYYNMLWCSLEVHLWYTCSTI